VGVSDCLSKSESADWPRALFSERFFPPTCTAASSLRPASLVAARDIVEAMCYLLWMVTELVAGAEGVSIAERPNERPLGRGGAYVHKALLVSSNYRRLTAGYFLGEAGRKT
jgi:hypothetical protein